MVCTHPRVELRDDRWVCVVCEETLAYQDHLEGLPDLTDRADWED